MINVYNKESNALLGEISEEDLQFLVDNLVEEFLEDTDYYINEPVLTMLLEKGLTPAVGDMLKKNMNEAGEIEIIYKKSE